jgi:hypothetical protein
MGLKGLCKQKFKIRETGTLNILRAYYHRLCSSESGLAHHLAFPGDGTEPTVTLSYLPLGKRAVIKVKVTSH